MFKGKIICLMGPTCVGKTSLSINLLNYFPFEIISVDSCLVYKYMNIGTGKPSSNFLKKFKHNLIDVCDPSRNYSVFDFCYDAYLSIYSCWERGRIPLLVGGSMMYYMCLFNFFYGKFLGCKNLQNSYISFFINNIFRKVKFFNIAIVPVDKYKLYNRIEKRLYWMLKRGFLDEVYYLCRCMNLNLSNKSICSIGYRELYFYINGKLSFCDAKDKIIRSTISLSNKQLLWLKQWKKNIIFIEDTKSCTSFYLLNLLNRYIN